MDILFILTSVNKIALIAFIITLFFIIFEVYQFTTQGKKKSKLTIPDFDTHKKYRPIITAKPAVKKVEKKMYHVTLHNKVIFICIGIVIIIVTMHLGSIFINSKKPTQQVVKPNEQLQVTSSPGIRIYDDKWQEISMDDLQRVVSGSKIFIGIETVQGMFIDKARIRINKNVWQKSDETNLFKSADRIFYREYQIATSESQLRIEAQVHTPSSGWLE